MLGASTDTLVAVEATGHYWKNLFAESRASPRRNGPPATRLPDRATEELRELVRFRDRLRQDFGDRVRQLHRLVDLGFPEFTRHVRDLGSELATALLRDCPTAAGFHCVPVRRAAAFATMGATKSARTLPLP